MCRMIIEHEIIGAIQVGVSARANRILSLPVIIKVFRAQLVACDTFPKFNRFAMKWQNNGALPLKIKFSGVIEMPSYWNIKNQIANILKIVEYNILSNLLGRKC